MIRRVGDPGCDAIVAARMDDFDHDALYYRILGTGDGYMFRTDEPAEIAANPKVHDRPFYEFDDLRTIGDWLFLGDRVLVLKIPPDAIVEENTPMSQGGCMAYSSSAVEPVGVLSFADLMRTYDAAEMRPGGIHLRRQQFADFALPVRGVKRLNLDHCHGHIDLSGVTERLCLWQCELEVLAWPKALGELDVTGGRLTGPLAPSRGLSLSSVLLADARVPAGAQHVSMFRCTGRVDLSEVRGSLSLTQCDLEITGVAAEVTHLYASESRFTGIPDLPAAARRSVKDCTFTPAV